MFVVAGVFVVTVMLVVAIVIIIARVHRRNMLTMHVRITRACMMEAAPEYRVQQHRCDGDNPARGVPVLHPGGVVIFSFSTI